MDVIGKLNKIRLSKNMSVYRLAELSGINQSTLANTFSRGTVPSVKNLECLCEALGLTLAQFFAEEEISVALTKDEAALLNDYRKLPKTVKEAFCKTIEEVTKNV